MTIILFLIDTSGSMNQRTHYGARPTLLDVTKETVEKFIKLRQRDPASRGDRYMLLTFDDTPFNIKAGWKENHAVFINELKNLTATGMTTLGPALKNAFDYLNINRMQTGIDTHGQGRCPYYLEAAIIIAITDGARITSTTNVQPELNLPMNTPCPGAELTMEPFRWDQRLFSIVLRLSGTYTIEPQANGTTLANFPVPCDDSPINAMCDVTGGRSFCVTSQRALSASLEQLITRMHIGVMIKFEKYGPDPPLVIPSEEDAADINNRSWTSVRNLIYVRSAQKGYSVGHWPIPEAYWPDMGIPNLQPRTAHPIIRFTCTNSEPTVIDNLPFDKYELDPSPLTQFILARKQPNVAWQVYVANSQRNSELGQPFGYLKASTSLTCVNLFVLPYNYPVLLPLLDELFKVHQGKPTREWRQQFENYLKAMPIYYAIPLRRALQRMGANSALIPESLDAYTTVTLNNLIKKNKNLAKIEFEKLAAAVGSQKPMTVEWPRISTNHLFPFSRKSNPEHCSNPSLKKLFSSLQNDQQDFNGFVVRYKEKANSESKAHCYRNPFDISRHDLIDQVHKLRRNFFQKQTSLIKFQDEDQMHSLPVSQMGNYQEYLKRLPVPLRELEATPTRQHMFGNPFKLDKKNMMMIDETDIDLVGNNSSPSRNSTPTNNATSTATSNGGNSGSNNNSKRGATDSYVIVGNKPKRKPGPLPKDFPYTRPLTPPPSPVPSPVYSPSSSPSHSPYTSPSITFNAHQNSVTNFSQYHLNPSMQFQASATNGSFSGKSPAQPNGHFSKPTKVMPQPFTMQQQQQGGNHIAANNSNSSSKPFEPSDIILISTVNNNSNSNSNHLNAGPMPIDANLMHRMNRGSVYLNSNNKRPLPMTNGMPPPAGANKLAKVTNQHLEQQNGFEDLSGYFLNFYRRKNFTMEEYEIKTKAMKLVRRSSKDDSEILQYLSSIEGSFGQYILLEVVHEAIRFKKKSIIHSLRSHAHFGPKMEKILLANNLSEDGQVRQTQKTCK